MCEEIKPMKHLARLFIADPYHENLLPAPLDMVYAHDEVIEAHNRVIPIYSTSESDQSNLAELAALEIKEGATDWDIIAVLQSSGFPIQGISQDLIPDSLGHQVRYKVTLDEVPGLLNLNVKI